MARIRTIKPEFFSHEEMATTSAHARLLAIGLLTLADCRGRLRWVPMQVHSQVFPWEADVKIESLLGELVGIGYCVHYEKEGKRYVAIAKFTEHQRLSGKEASYESRLPSPPDEDQKSSENTEKTGEEKGKYPGASLGSNGNPLGTGEQGNIGTGEQGNIVNTHTHTRASKSKVRFEIPMEIADAWVKWCEFRFAIDGRAMPDTQVETVLMDLGRRGWDKAKRDIDFSIRKSAKTILDSDRDFERPTSGKQTTQRKRNFTL